MILIAEFFFLFRIESQEVEITKISVHFRAALGRVCLKLVIVMGVTWIVDVLSWAIGGPHYVWYFSDIVNSLQGLFIFIVVGCQPQVNFSPFVLHSTEDNKRFSLFRLLFTLKFKHSTVYVYSTGVVGS